GTNRTIWSRAAPLLAAERPVTALDLPGFGASPAPERWTIESVAELIAETLETDLGPGFDLLGSSLGGAVALQIAAARPDLVHRLVLAAPAGFRPAPGPLPRVASLIAGPMLSVRRSAGLRFAGQAQARRALLAGSVGDGAALDPEAARLMLRASEGAHSLQPAMEAAASADLRQRAARLEVPFGLIWGTLDRVIPAHTAERVLELHPDVPLELIGGAGHLPHLEVPEQFAAALERVFSQLP
ncbi:MAG TPA: alpha/beta fold hydrolase, partial [Solirubrobacterales bacterium]|nr:alpha/beta fold hydrolase [Solirubrobacterales bacterium]